MVTRDALQQRKASLEIGLEQLQANLHATQGAIAECDYWLAQLDTPAVAPANDTPPTSGGGDSQ